MATTKSKGVVAAYPSDTQQKKWQAEDDLRTLQRAKEIEASRSRMAAAEREAKAQMAALSKIKRK